MKTGVSVKDAMTKDPIVVNTDNSIKECVKIMAKNKIGSLVIVSAGKVMGVIKERDIVRGVILDGVDASTALVKDYMVEDVVTITPDVDIYDALVKMRDMDVRILPVMNNEKLIGLLTVKDILKVQPSLFDLLAEKLVIREEEDKPIFMRRDF